MRHGHSGLCWCLPGTLRPVAADGFHVSLMRLMDFGAVDGDDVENALFAGVSSAKTVVEELFF